MPAMTDRIQTLGEEIANAASHGVALVAAIATMPFLIIAASQRHPAAVVGAAVFGATMVLLYVCSTLYHALPQGRGKRVFLVLDHSAIYLFIAGSYTPFALGALSGPWGWSLFGVVWALAAAGVALKAFQRLSQPWLSTGLYLAMGWLVLVAAVPLMERMPEAGLWWLLAGGLAYTVGVVFFVLDQRMRYAHAVWHGFVAAGTGLHVVAVMGYAG
jgi:hemolysin III